MVVKGCLYFPADGAIKASQRWPKFTEKCTFAINNNGLINDNKATTDNQISSLLCQDKLAS